MWQPRTLNFLILRVRALTLRAQIAYRFLSTDIPSYVKRNKRTLFRYTAAYLLLWLPEWAWGFAQELSVVVVFSILVLLDLNYFCPWKGRGYQHLSQVRKREASRKKYSLLQKLEARLFFSFYVGIRGFFSNPSYRIAKSQSYGVASLLFYFFFIQNVLEAFICAPLLGRAVEMPTSYRGGREAALFFVESLLFENSLYHNESHVMGWALGLLVFLLLTSTVWLATNYDMPMTLVGALRTISLSLISIIFLEASKAWVIDLAYVTLGCTTLLSGRQVAALYLLTQLMWGLLYYMAYQRFKEKNRRGAARVFIRMVNLVNPSKGQTTMGWIATQLARAPLATIIPALSFSYLLVRLAFLALAG